MEKLRCFLLLILGIVLSVQSYGQEKDACTITNSGFGSCLGDIEISENDFSEIEMNEKGFNTSPFSVEIHGKISVYHSYTKVKSKKYSAPKD